MDLFARTDVLVIAGVLYAVEFVADKIPYVARHVPVPAYGTQM